VYVAQKIAQTKTDDEVIRLCDRFYEYYRRHAKYGERTAHFVERIGLKTVTDAILNAPEAELRTLEESFQQALDNYRDPWLEPAGEPEAEDAGEGPEDADGFVSLAPASAVPPGTSRLFHVRDEPVAVFHGRDGSWVAAHGVCPHKSGPLVDSIYGNGRLVCPLHSYSFDAATGACDNPDIRPVRIYGTRIAGGQLQVRPVRAPSGKGGSLD
jgi:nitrite reductase (NADH) small subunit